MLSIIAGAMIAAAFSYAGVGIKRIYRIKRDFYADFSDFLAFSKTEIVNLKTPVPDIIDRFTEDKTGLAVEILQKSKGYIVDGNRNSILAIKSVYLKKSELYDALSFLSTLGVKQLSEQLELISVAVSKTERLGECADKNLSTLGNMYYKLAVLLGVAVMLLVV